MGYYIYFSVLSFILGLVFGSFGNAWAWRIVNHENIARGRSHCTLCGHTLGFLDLVPLFSYIFLKGKCRYCGAKIPIRYPIAEAVMGLFFLSIFLRYDVSWDLLRFLLMVFFLFVAALVDIDIMELPDGLLIAAGAAAFLRFIGNLGVWKEMLIGFFAISVPLLLLVLLMDTVLRKNTMGGGDIKLIAVLGLHFGALGTLLLLILACVAGLTVAALTKKKRDQAFPFGPMLVGAAWICAIVAQPLIDAYLSLF